MLSRVVLNFTHVNLQQCHLIDLFCYRNPGHGQKGHMNKVCPSFCSEVFMELALQFFSGTQHGVRGPCGVVYDRFTPKMGKRGHAQGSLNVQKSSVFFPSTLFFYQCGLHVPFCLGGGGGGGGWGQLSLQPNFQNGEAQQDLNLQKGVARKEGVNFSDGGGLVGIVT